MTASSKLCSTAAVTKPLLSGSAKLRRKLEAMLGPCVLIRMELLKRPRMVSNWVGGKVSAENGNDKS